MSEAAHTPAGHLGAVARLVDLQEQHIGVRERQPVEVGLHHLARATPAAGDRVAARAHAQ